MSGQGQPASPSPGWQPPMAGPAVSAPHLGKLAAKLVAVMASVGTIPKRGKNAFYGYEYATEADVSDAVRKALVANGVVLIPSILDVTERTVQTRQGKPETVTTVTIECTFIDAESGMSLRFRMMGAGQDPGDKGVMKAITAATKYAALKALCLSTGDDPEDDTRDGAGAGRESADGRTRTSTPEREPGAHDDAPWPDEDQAPPPARSAPPPAERHGRPRPEDCINEAKVRRLYALMNEKVRDFEWGKDQIVDYLRRHLERQYGIGHLHDIPWKGDTYNRICDWIQALGAP